MNKSVLKSIWPHILAVGIFIFFIIIYFNPIFFDGKELQLHDAFQGIAAGKEAADYRERTGEEALWSNSMFGGMPLYIISVVYDGDLLVYLRNILLFLPGSSAMVFLSFISFYIMLLIFRCRPLTAFIGSFAYAFSTYTFISVEAGHLYKVIAMGYAPLLLSGVILAFRKKYLWGFVLTAIAVAFQLSAQHFQITYYFVLLLGIFVIVELVKAIKNKTFTELLKVGGVLLLAAALGVTANLGRLWTVQEYSQYSIRGKSELSDRIENGSGGLDKDYAFAWSQGKMETLTLMIPNLFGGASQIELDEKSDTYKTLRRQGVPVADAKQFVENAPMYWGDQPFTSGPIYGGVIIVFLFILSLFVMKSEFRWWLLAGTVFSILLSWGNNFESFNYFMFEHFPGYNKFRAVSMAMVIALFCIPLGATLGLEQVIEDYRNKSKDLYKNILIAAGITGGVLFLVLLFSGSASYQAPVDERLPEWLRSAIRSDRQSMLRSDTLRGLFLIGLAFALIVAYVKNKLSLNVFLFSVAVLVVIDFWSVNKRFLDDSDFIRNPKEKFFEPTQADKIILQDKDPYFRVFNLSNPFNEARTSYYHKSIGGYHGAKIRRYQDLIEHHLSKQNMSVINMLNTRYIITGDQRNPVQRNPDAMGNAWFIENIKKVNNPKEEIEALNDFNPSKTAVLDASKFDASGAQFNKEGNITLTSYEPNHLKFKVNASQPGFAVFSDIYYPEGWQAYIDGKPVNHVRVNYILRGMEIPQGDHVVEFIFDPTSFRVGNQVMLYSSLLILLILAGLIIKEAIAVKKA